MWAWLWSPPKQVGAVQPYYVSTISSHTPLFCCTYIPVTIDTNFKPANHINHLKPKYVGGGKNKN
jgi:hypothetical protein